MKVQTKLALILGIVFIIIIILLGSVIYYFQNQYAFIDFYKRLETRASISAKYNLDTDTLNSENLMFLKNQHLEKLEQEKEYLIPLTSDLSVNTVAKKYGLPELFLKEVIEKGKSTEKRGNVFFVGTKEKKLDKYYIVIVSAENYYVSHHLIFLRNMIIWSVLLGTIVVVSLSFYFSRHIFFPIRKITDRVKLISTENIHLRLDNSGKSFEIAELTNTFNDLLNRIETAFETQKNFISNASHELGTPLTSVIGEADVALLKDRSTEEYKKSLQNILVQAGRLDQITKSLLFLAQTGYKGKAITFEMVRIDEIVWETKSIIDQLNPNNKIIIDLSLLPENPKKLKIKGNKQLLHLALANILNNACKYSNNNTVTVYIGSSEAQVIVTVKDLGIGIPEADLKYIYDPFFRASNTKIYEGYGIGLPLARNVINLHKGSLLVTSKVNVGTTVQIKLPLMQV